VTGVNATISLAACQLGRDELVAVFTGLNAAGAGKTITVTNNWGVPNLSVADKAIATGKGWTLTL
jgi:hypothetical protein